MQALLLLSLLVRSVLSSFRFSLAHTLNTSVNIPVAMAKQMRKRNIMYYVMHFGLIKIYPMVYTDSNSFQRFGIVITVCIFLSTLLLKLETVRGFGFVRNMHSPKL